MGVANRSGSSKTGTICKLVLQTLDIADLGSAICIPQIRHRLPQVMLLRNLPFSLPLSVV